MTVIEPGPEPIYLRFSRRNCDEEDASILLQQEACRSLVRAAGLRMVPPPREPPPGPGASTCDPGSDPLS